MESEKDNFFMELAIDQAKKAAAMGEVPVGAIVVCNGEVIASAHNLRESAADPTAHAELLAIRKAAEKLGKWRLSGCDLYVTLEPCAMCAGAMVLARIDRLIYGAEDPKAGAAKTLYEIPTDARLNHQVEVTSGILAEKCGNLLSDFFKKKRG